MPDSFGKRQRNAQKARKFAAREERRAARKRQREDQAGGTSEGRMPDESPEDGSDRDLEGNTETSEPGSGDDAE